MNLVWKFSAPEILQRSAPQPGALLFSALRSKRPSAPANPGPNWLQNRAVLTAAVS